MKLAGKFACALIALYLGVFAAAGAILDHFVRADFQRVEADQNERDTLRVKAGLAAYKRELEARVNDYAEWDDTRNFLMGRAPDFPKRNFSEGWFEKYGVDLALFVDGKGKPVWGRNHARDGSLEASEFLFDVVVNDARAGQRRGGQMVAGAVWTQHGPLIYAARPASNSEGTASPLGLVIIGRYLSAPALREQTQLDLDVLKTESASDKPAFRNGLTQLFRTDASEVSWIENGRRQSLIALRGADGRAVGAIHARPSAVTSPLGSQSLQIAVVLLAALFAAALLALWFVVQAQVISRLRALERHFDREDDFKALPQPKSGDEIGRIVRAYNALVTRTYEAMAAEQRAVLDREAHARAEQIKTDFIANMSHELRTPLTAIMGYCELLQEDVSAAGLNGSSGDVAKIQDAANQLLVLINEILDMSKIESGQIELNPKSFDVAEMLQAAADASQAAAAQNGNTLTVQCLGSLGFARTDEVRLRQCVNQLLSNACKFTHDGQIVIRAERMRIENAPWIRVEVHDSGIGMNADQMTRIFDPFVQADNSNTRRYGGMGLGLAMTKRVVNLLGGTIAARSRQGFGSMFILSVPAALSAEQGAPRFERAVA